MTTTGFGASAPRKEDPALLRKRADRLMLLLGITDLRDTFVRELSTGSRRLVDLACVLAGDPEVLLLDEPSSGIAQKETEEMPALLERITERHGPGDLKIPARLYPLFLQGFLATVAEFDPGYSAEVEAAWRSALAPGFAIVSGVAR